MSLAAPCETRKFRPPAKHVPNAFSGERTASQFFKNGVTVWYTFREFHPRHLPISFGSPKARRHRKLLPFLLFRGGVDPILIGAQYLTTIASHRSEFFCYHIAMRSWIGRFGFYHDYFPRDSHVLPSGPFTFAIDASFDLIASLLSASEIPLYTPLP